jgi:hypothetical protein
MPIIRLVAHWLKAIGLVLIPFGAALICGAGNLSADHMNATSPYRLAAASGMFRETGAVVCLLGVVLCLISKIIALMDRDK